MGEKTLIFLSRQYHGKFQTFFHKNRYIFMTMYCAPYAIIASEVDTISKFKTSGANCLYDHRIHTELQLLLSGVHSIMMEKLSQPCEGVGCMPTSFQSTKL